MQGWIPITKFVIMNGIGPYKTLKGYRKAVVIYDMTYYFCDRFLKCGDRTIDQMVQAARSGKQNIVEGVSVGETSKEMMLKLLYVAKGSLQELLADYEDYLRVRNLRMWETDSVEVESMRKLGIEHDDSSFFLSLAESRNDEVIANMVIVLIHQADVLIGNYYNYQYKKFLEEGGFREKLKRERLANREKELGDKKKIL